MKENHGIRVPNCTSRPLAKDNKQIQNPINVLYHEIWPCIIPQESTMDAKYERFASSKQQEALFIASRLCLKGVACFLYIVEVFRLLDHHVFPHVPNPYR